MEGWDGVGLKLASGASRYLADKGGGGGNSFHNTLWVTTLKVHPLLEVGYCYSECNCVFLSSVRTNTR